MDESVWIKWLQINGAFFFGAWAIAYIIEWRNERRDLNLPTGFSDFVQHAVTMLIMSAIIASIIAYVGYVLVFKKGFKNAEHK